METVKPSSGLGTRVLSSLLLAPIAVAIIGYGHIPFTAMIALAFILALKEWYGMCRLAKHPWLQMIAGFIYLSCCLISFALLRLAFHGGGWLALGLIVGIWASDSGAYMTGRTFGGPKLAPKISPKKTWSGFAGSMVFCAVAITLVLLVSPFSHWMHGMNVPWSRHRAGLPVINLTYVFIEGIWLGIVGQAGDLLISKFKRSVGLKDTGNLIPGHGGLLDRIDALLLAAPFFLAFAWYFLR